MMHDQLLLAAPGSVEPGDRPPEQVTLLIEPGGAGRDIDLYARFAWAAGLFGNAGLAVRIVRGQVEVARLVVPEPHLAVVDFSAVGDRKVVAAIHQRTATGLVGFADTGLATAADLAGRVVGLAPGSVARTLWPAYSRRSGLGPTAVATVDTEDPAAGLATGRLDAAGLPLVEAPRIAQNASRDVVILPYAEVLPESYGSVLVVSGSPAGDQLDVVRRLTAALLAAVRFAVDEPEEVAQVLYRSYLVDDPALAAAELRLMRTYVSSGLSPGQSPGNVDPARLAHDREGLESS